MIYQRIFDPDNAYQPSAEDSHANGEHCNGFGDSQSTKYFFSQEIIFAINVAIATGRPLLVGGPTGCGKSAMAQAVAKVLKRRFCSFTITSHTKMDDLYYKIDMVRRLADAHVEKGDGMVNVSDLEKYIRPGPFWWAFDPTGAEGIMSKSRGNNNEPSSKTDVQICKAQDIAGKEVKNPEGTLILLDEMDKADPDLPNNLLRTLGNMEFHIPELGKTIEAPPSNPAVSFSEEFKKRPLIFLTTNDEQTFSEPFIRRCIRVNVKTPENQEEYKVIARLHFGGKNEIVPHKVAQAMIEKCKQRGDFPSIAEYLDAVRTVCRLFPQATSINTGEFFNTDDWKFIQEKVLGIPLQDETKDSP
ncbi:MAG: MoxR family ATPase [Nitrospirae bacterium]|nr:MoxR family ATPase [Magnetococcales bacterium]HAT50517.1 hypothetical protein [Alphaproteobacteria bacterium]